MCLQVLSSLMITLHWVGVDREVCINVSNAQQSHTWPLGERKGEDLCESSCHSGQFETLDLSCKCQSPSQGCHRNSILDMFNILQQGSASGESEGGVMTCNVRVEGDTNPGEIHLAGCSCRVVSWTVNFVMSKIHVTREELAAGRLNWFSYWVSRCSSASSLASYHDKGEAKLCRPFPDPLPTPSTAFFLRLFAS